MSARAVPIGGRPTHFYHPTGDFAMTGRLDPPGSPQQRRNLLNYARREFWWLDDWDLEDILQTAYINLIRWRQQREKQPALPQDRAESPGTIYTIVLRAGKQHIRKLRRDRGVLEIHSAICSTRCRRSLDPKLIATLWGCFAKLDRETQVLIRMNKIESTSVIKSATRLGMTRPQADRLIMKGLATLKTNLTAWLELHEAAATQRSCPACRLALMRAA